MDGNDNPGYSNAFNSAGWDLITKELDNRGISAYLRNIIGRYFQEWALIVHNGEEMPVTRGVPQGSVLGPILWNIMYDGVLRTKLPDGAVSIAYADDLALVARGEDKEELMFVANESLRRIGVWMERNRLKIAPEKSEALIIKGSRNRTGISFHISGNEIEVKRAINYLGIIIDDRNSFGPHIKGAVVKAEGKVSKLMRILWVTLYNVVQSVLLYGAPIWHTAVLTTSYRKKLEAVQRRMVLRVASAYRTVSAQAVQVITGIPPILLVRERKKTL